MRMSLMSLSSPTVLDSILPLYVLMACVQTFFDESSQIVVARELRRQVRMLPANPTAVSAFLRLIFLLLIIMTFLIAMSVRRDWQNWCINGIQKLG